jgi:hypothetical protein
VDTISTATGRTAAKVALPGSVDQIAAGSGGLFYAAVLPRRGPARFCRIAWPARGGDRAPDPRAVPRNRLPRGLP